MAALRRRNRATFLALALLVAGMTGLAFASVPLYRLFCQVTGYGGTTQVAERAAAAPGERIVVVRFDAATAPGLPWRFQPNQREVRLRVGEETLASYRAENRGREAVVGTATFNVTPAKAGRYFNKIECFCFTEQRLEPGQAVDMPVSFFVDPAIAADRDTSDVTTITLSYTFFPRREGARSGERG